MADAASPCAAFATTPFTDVPSCWNCWTTSCTWVSISSSLAQILVAARNVTDDDFVDVNHHERRFVCLDEVLHHG